MVIKKQLLFALLFMATFAINAQDLKVLTYNLRYDNAGDGENAWNKRRLWICEQIRQTDPDIFCIQEGLISQMKYLDSTFTNYRYVGVGRDNGKAEGEFSAIFYKTSKLKVIRRSTFWLSETPGKVSKGWDAACIRICTNALLKFKTSGKKFRIYNTHLDHIGTLARKESAALILQEIGSATPLGLPVILTGDFNADPQSEVYSVISGNMTDTKIADKSASAGPDGTFNGFDPQKPATERIDYIFIQGKTIKPINYQVIRESRDGRYASDHFPVITELRID